jgi:predicted aspartyl protease
LIDKKLVRLGRTAALLFGSLVALPAVLCGQTVKAPVEVPFEFVHNQIVVQVKVNSKGPFAMLLDTDTDPSAIDSATARELGLAVGSSGSRATGSGTEVNTVYPATLGTVELEGIIAKQVAATTIDLSRLSKRIGRPVQGVLGFSFLKDRIVQIDYENSRLRFYAQSQYPGIQAGPNTVNIIAFPLRREDGLLIIDSVFINNEKMRATLDTGSSGTFSLTPEAVAILGLDEQANDGKTETSVGYNGEYEAKSGLLKSVRLGRYSLDSVRVTLWLPNTGHDKKTYQVNIGNGFFQDFKMTFDFKNKMVVFERVE